jgi:hypothetical protein
MGDRGAEYIRELQAAISRDDPDSIIDISTHLLGFRSNDPGAKLSRAIAYL